MGISPLAVLGAGILNGLVNNMQNKMAIDEYNKGLQALTDYINNPTNLGEQKTYTDLTPQGQGIKDVTTQNLLGNPADLASQVMGGYTPTVPTSADVGKGLLGYKPQGLADVIKPITDAMQKYAPGNNPVKVETTWNFNPLQFQIGLQKAIANSGISPETMQKLSPLLSTAVQQAKENSTKKQYESYTNDLLNATDPAQQKRALINMYLTDPQRIPYQIVEGLVKTNITPVDTGNAIALYRTDEFNNYLDVGKDGKPVPYFAIAKQPTPDTAIKVAEQAREWGTPSGNTIATLGERRFEHVTPSGNAQLQAETQRWMHSTPSGSVVYQTNAANKPGALALKAAQQIVDAHNAWVKANPGADQSQSPYYSYVQAAVDTLAKAGGIQPQLSLQDQDIANKIDQARMAGYSPEEIKNYLVTHGLGQYVSWVW